MRDSKAGASSTEAARATGQEAGPRDIGVTLDRTGSVALLTLNDPKSFNALSAPVKAGLEQHISAIAADDGIRAIVITGTGPAFCAGGDIRSMDERSAVSVHDRMKKTHSWLVTLLNMRKPVISAVNGAAAGAGFALAMAGDFVCVSPAARFKCGFFGIGAVPDLGLAYTLPRAIGMVRAKDILLSNREVGAEEALSIGLASRLFSGEDLLSSSMALAEELANGPTLAYGFAKTLLQRSYQLPLDGFLDAENGAQVAAFGTSDFAEGVAAFRGKRKARFSGR